nr:helix-turn-helix transcriptional regulator [Streptomyces sp. Xyl84]
MSNQAPNQARVIPLRPQAARPASAHFPQGHTSPDRPAPGRPAPGRPASGAPAGRTAPAREPLWRDLVGDILRRERLAQERTLKDVADAARISMPYLSEIERGRKEASSEVLAAAAQALGLGLAGLLALAQGELLRVTSRTAGRGRGTTASSVSSVSSASSAAPASRFDGLCLAA